MSIIPTSPAATPRPARRARTTPLAARGEPMVWVTALAMATCLGMIGFLLITTIREGSRTFWPRPIDTVTLRSGERFLGVPIREEPFDPSPQVKAELDEAHRGVLGGAAGSTRAVPAQDSRPVQRLYRIGNKEVNGQAFRWVPISLIASIERDPRAVLLEREEWGVWIGLAEAIVEVEPPQPGDDQSAANRLRQVVSAEEFRIRFGEFHERARELRRRQQRLERVEIASINTEIESARLTLRQAEIDHARGPRTPFWPALGPWIPWSCAVVCSVAALAMLVRRLRADPGVRVLPGKTGPRHGVITAALAAGVLGLSLFVLLERPWSARPTSEELLTAARAVHDRAVAEAGRRADDVRAQIGELAERDLATRVIVRDPTADRFAPLTKEEPDEPLRLSRVVRCVHANALSTGDKIGVYLSRWREFIFDEPREANTEGGILPVIFGTVTLTLLLSMLVVPLGVIAALYMREYARQGLIISAVRVAVNNLAGVPSVVYGVFGLGFFCYSVGQYLDGGPAAPVSRAAWWLGVFAVMVAAIGAIALGAAARPTPGRPRSDRAGLLAVAGGAVWLAAGLGALALLAGSPYFHGFFEARGPAPTLGRPALLWSALTLALLTLPVVIVATEEAIAAVPRSMREGSYGCGASRWQTIRRIVLPRAMPGIMTGMILAMARGAGEVAPLMLVGAVKLAPQLPVSAEFPFLHLERSFMHLGFHIYDVGFQSPDSEAARPTVWTTAFVLITIVLLLNLAAIRVRSRLRRRFQGGAF